MHYCPDCGEVCDCGCSTVLAYEDCNHCSIIQDDIFEQDDEVYYDEDEQ